MWNVLLDGRYAEEFSVGSGLITIILVSTILGGIVVLVAFCTLEVSFAFAFRVRHQQVLSLPRPRHHEGSTLTCHGTGDVAMCLLVRCAKSSGEGTTLAGTCKASPVGRRRAVSSLSS